MTDRDDWWVQKRSKSAGPLPVSGGSDNSESIHLPQPSYWPIVVSIVLLIGGYGLIYSNIIAVVGVSISIVAVYAWSFEPVNDPEDSTH